MGVNSDLYRWRLRGATVTIVHGAWQGAGAASPRHGEQASGGLRSGPDPSQSTCREAGSAGERGHPVSDATQGVLAVRQEEWQGRVTQPIRVRAALHRTRQRVTETA